MKKVFFLAFSCLYLSAFSSPQAYAKTTAIPVVKKGEPLPSDLFIELNKAVNPAVVNISTETLPKLRKRNSNPRGFNQDPMEQLFQQFFGNRGGMMDRFKSRPEKSLGTGFIIRKDGLIITNSHVIDNADVINIQLSEKDEKTYRAEVIGKDSRTDVALIKIDAGKKLPFVKLGTSAALQVGEWVAAFGNPFGHGHSMSKGIVSAIGRDLDQINLFPFIQTDASINPGNSGGPLVNVKGEVIGVNTAIDARAQGIGFAIPIDEVKTIVKQLEETGSVSRGFLGVEMRTMNEQIAADLGFKQTEGAIIVNVVPESAAARAKLKPYDIITKLDKEKIKTSAELAKYIGRAPIGKPVVAEVIREHKKKKVKITLGDSNQLLKPKRKDLKPFPELNPKDKLFSAYGFSVSDITSKAKKLYDIKKAGKHQAYVSRVVGYSPASKAGLREGDIVYEINRRSIFSAKDARRVFKQNKNTFLIRVKRGKAFLLIRLEP
ncbi:MAG: Do family serine endopeptidase [Bdellovibrionales bacterium]